MAMGDVAVRTVGFACPNGHVEGSVTTRAAVITPPSAVDPTRATPEESRPAITPEDALDGPGECPECGEGYVYEWE